MADNTIFQSAENIMPDPAQPDAGRMANMILKKEPELLLPLSKEEEKRAAFEKLNEQLQAVLASFPNDKYTQVNFQILPLKKREFFENLNNPYTFASYEGKPDIPFNALAGTVISYGILKVTEYNARSGILGYPTTVGGSTNWLDPLVMNSTVPLSLYKAYTKPDSTLPKSDLGMVAGACMLTNTIIGDGIYDSINKVPPGKVPPSARFLMAVIGLYGNLNPTIMPLADKGNQYGIVNSVAGGLNVSPDSVSLYTLANLLLRYKKIVYLYNIAMGKNVEKPKEGAITAGSYTQNGNPYTGIKWAW